MALVSGNQTEGVWYLMLPGRILLTRPNVILAPEVPQHRVLIITKGEQRFS